MAAGGCFCGGVRYETGALKSATYCHCSKCRKWHGWAGAYTATERTAFKLSSEKTLKWHRVSPTVRRGFCAECGSVLFFDEEPDAMMGIVVGSLDEPTGLESKAHIFVGSKGDWYELHDDGLIHLSEGPGSAPQPPGKR